MRLLIIINCTYKWLWIKLSKHEHKNPKNWLCKIYHDRHYTFSKYKNIYKVRKRAQESFNRNFPQKNRIQFVPTTRVLKQNHSCGSECHDTKQFRQWKKANFVPMFLVPFDSSVENFWCNCCVAQLVSSMRVNLKWMNINQLNISKVLIYEKIEKNNLTNIQIIKRKKI